MDAAVDPVGDTAMFTITVSADGSTASTPPVSEITPVKPVDTPAPSVSDTDGFVFADYKPTESLRADDNFLIINWLAEDHFKVDPSDPSVDPPTRTWNGLLTNTRGPGRWSVAALLSKQQQGYCAGSVDRTGARHRGDVPASGRLPGLWVSRIAANNSASRQPRKPTLVMANSTEPAKLWPQREASGAALPASVAVGALPAGFGPIRVCC